MTVRLLRLTKSQTAGETAAAGPNEIGTARLEDRHLCVRACGPGSRVSAE